MAADKSMTNSAEIVAKAMIEEHSDFLKESAAMIAQQVMEAEIASQIGAQRGEISGDRSTHRNGYRQRDWNTRVGESELAVPRKRSEKALLSVVMEAYINGVSAHERCRSYSAGVSIISELCLRRGSYRVPWRGSYRVPWKGV